MIYKLFSSWGPENVPTRTRIWDIAIFVGTFCPNKLGITKTHTYTHTNQNCFKVLLINGTFSRVCFSYFIAQKLKVVFIRFLGNTLFRLSTLDILLTK